MSAISSVEIANMALSHIGKDTIESLNEASAAAQQCKLWYDRALRSTFEAFDWSFARKRLTLALDGQAAPDQWTFRYQYPTDCVAMRRIWNPAGEKADPIPYEIEANDAELRTILTDMESAIGIFTFLLMNPVVYSELFVDALSHQLASRIAYKMTGKRTIKIDELQTFTAVLKQADAANANEKVEAAPRDAEWIRGRGFNPDFDRIIR